MGKQVSVSWMPRFWFVVVALSLAAQMLTAAGKLETLKETFDKSLKDITDKQVESISALDSEYSTALTGALDQSRKGGNVEQAAAIEQYMQRWEDAKRRPPEDYDEGFPALKSMQVLYAGKVKQIEVDHARRIGMLLQQYESHLVALQIQLTRQGSAEDVRKVQEERARASQHPDVETARRILTPPAAEAKPGVVSQQPEVADEEPAAQAAQTVKPAEKPKTARKLRLGHDKQVLLPNALIFYLNGTIVGDLGDFAEYMKTWKETSNGDISVMKDHRVEWSRFKRSDENGRLFFSDNGWYLLEVDDIDGLPEELTGIKVPEPAEGDMRFRLGHSNWDGTTGPIIFHENGVVSGEKNIMEGNMVKWEKAGSGKLSVIGLGGTEWRLFKNSAKEPKRYKAEDDYFLEELEP